MVCTDMHVWCIFAYEKRPFRSVVNQWFRNKLGKIGMHLVEVIAYVVEDVRVVVGFEHFAEDGGYGTIFGCTLERAGVG